MLVLNIYGVDANDDGRRVICTLGVLNGVVKVLRGNKRLGEALINQPNKSIQADIHTEPEAWIEEFAEYYQGTYMWVGYPYRVSDIEELAAAL